jgi:DNA-binding response OmpR family regulator
MKKNSILIVEDDELIRGNIVEYFEYNGFDVFESENGKLGLDAAKKNIPDVIITDIMMPEMTGLEMMKELKIDSSTNLIPVILITAKVESKDIREGMSIGAEDYITKPFDLQDLLAAVNTQIGKKKKINDHIHLEYTKSFEHWKNIANHELFTPINVIQNVYHLISKNSNVDDELDSIFRLSVSRLKRTISNLLLLSGVYQLETNFKYISVDTFKSQIDQIITEVLENEKKLVKSKFDIQFKLPENFFIKEYFYLIIREVLDNAYKFSPAETKAQVVFEIIDDSFVLTTNNKNKINNTIPINSARAFTQVERNSYEQQGLGLGLYIVNRISNMFKDQFDISQAAENVECIWKSKIKFL